MSKKNKDLYSWREVNETVSKLMRKSVALMDNCWDGKNWNNEIYKKLEHEISRVDIEFKYWSKVQKEMNYNGWFWSCDDFYLMNRFGSIPFTKKYENN